MNVVNVKAKCTKCGSENTAKHGIVTVVGGQKKQRYKCSDCGHTFYLEET